MRRFFFLALVTAAACTAEKSETSEKPAAASTVTTPTVDNGTGPAATVNGVVVSRDLFQREYTQTMERYEKARHKVRPSLKERLKDNIVRRLVDMEVIKQEAAKLGVALTDEEKDQRWADHRKRYGTEEAFKAFLERAGTTEKDIRRQFNSNLLREKVFSQVASTVSVDEADVKKFYEDNVKRYTEPEQIKARHILIRKPRNADAKEATALKAKASKVLREVKRKSNNFEDLAKKYSEDVTKARGGELGWFAKGRMVKSFESAAWALKDGQVSNVVETNFGYHIIKREGYREARTKPFKEVEALIKRSLTARKRNQAIQDSMKKWREESKIEIFIKGDPEIIKQDLVKPRGAPSSQPGQPTVQPPKPAAQPKQ